MEKVRFGVIGAGNMGFAHLQNFMGGRIINGELTAIADLKPDKLERAKAKCEEVNPEAAKKMHYYASGDELIDAHTCDVVLVAIPHYFHPVYAIKALKSGYHCIVEKPAGVYTLQVQEMLDEAAKHPELKLGIMFNQRTNSGFRKMKQLIADGELGQITRLNWIITNWYRTQYYYDTGDWRATWKGEGGGVLYNQAPHNIDLFQWIPDMMPNKVRAFCKFGKWHDIEVEDDVTAYFEYPNGATGVFITTTADTPGTNRFEITGTKGRLIFDLANEHVVTFTRNNADSLEFIKSATTSFTRPEFADEYPELETVDQYHIEHSGIVNNFANCILGLEELIAPATDGIKGVTLANAMLLSAWTDSTVELPIDGKKFYDLLQEHINNSTFKKEVVADAGAVDMSGTYNSGKK